MDLALLEVAKAILDVEMESDAAKEKAKSAEKRVKQLQSMRKKYRADFKHGIFTREQAIVKREAVKWRKRLDQAVADAVADEQAKSDQKIKHIVSQPIARAATEFKKIPDAEIARLRLRCLQHQMDDAFQLSTAEAANAEAAENAAEVELYDAASAAEEHLVDDLRADDLRDAAREADIRRAREERTKKEKEHEVDFDMEESPRCDVDLE